MDRPRRVIVGTKLKFSVDGAISTLGLSSGPYFRSTAGLVRNTWFPVLDTAIPVDIDTTLPWEDGAPADSFGAIRAINGGDAIDPYILDQLLSAQVSGLEAETKRGYEDEDWENWEPYALTKSDRLSFDGEDLTITQRSALDALDQPLIQQVFDETTPNPRIVFRRVPLLMGPAFQIEGLIWDAPNQIHYIASNQSNVSAVREGGARTDNFGLLDFGVQMLQGSSPLQLTFDAIGPAPDTLSQSTVVDWAFDAWTGDNPDDIDVTEDPPEAEISQDGVNSLGDITVLATPTGDSGWVSLTDPFEPVFGGLEGNGAWSPVGAATVEDAVIADDGSYAQATIYGETTLRVGGFDPAVPAGYVLTGVEIEIIAESDNDSRFTVVTVNQTNPGSRIASFIGVAGSGILEDDLNGGAKTTLTGGGTNFIGGGVGVKEEVTAEEVNSVGLHFTIKVKPRSTASETIKIYQVRTKVHYAPSIDIVRLFTPTGVLEPGERHTVTLDLAAADIYARWGSATASGGVLKDASDPFSTSLAKLENPGRYEFEFVPEKGESFFGIEFKRLNTAGTAKVDRITVKKRAAGKNRLTALVPYAVGLVGLSDDDINSAQLTALGDATGNPEIGKYITSNESAAEVIDLFMRSHSAIWWRGADAKIGCRLWKLDRDATPTARLEDIEVDGIRQSIRLIKPVTIETDPAPRATEIAVGAKNERPLRVSETAGITEEFSEQQLANVIEEWRVRRRANFDSLDPWPDA